MAMDNASDLFMTFIKNGKPIEAASRTNFQPKGVSTRLLKDIKPGYVFEVSKFSFGAGTVDDSGGGYQDWRGGKAIEYPVDMHPVTFTRTIDKSSAYFLQNCIDCEGYDRVILIKRKPVGKLAAGEPFLRFDFSNVLMVSVDWSNDDEVEETCQFIFRAVTISYRPQLPDGSLGAVVPAFWSMAPDERPVTL
jgi:type VI protein secretion system component Hcp